MMNLLRQPALRGLTIGLAAFALASFSAKATPYASGCTNYTPDGKNGDIGFFLNEAADAVTVIYDDGTTNANFNGITTGLSVPRGSNYFNLGGHDGYQIRVSKVGGGTPVQISSDTDSNSIWANPRGVGVNQNPKYGDRFGRIYCGSGGTGGYGWGTAGFKNFGIYPLNADFTTALGQGTNSYGYSVFSGSGGSGPWRMRVAPANSGLNDGLLVTDFSGSGAGLWIFAADLSSQQPLLKGIGGAAGLAAQTHNDSPWEMAVSGSLANGDLKIWLTEADWAIPGSFDSYGPNTGSGMYNDVLRFDVGAGPIPVDGWPGPPQWAYTVGLEGIANLRPCAVDISPEGNIICGFGRANGSNPNMQILDPSGYNFLYMGGQAQPYYSQDVGGLSGIDPWNGRLSGHGAQVGTYAGIKVSPDGKYIAAVDLNNGITIANLVGGIPDESTIFNIPNTPTVGNARGMDWDLAGNLYVCSSGQGLLRAFSLGGTATCVTSNDWTGTNGMFTLAPPPLVAKIDATQPNASQNYINNPTPGAPIPGVARISLNTNFLSGPVTVSFTRAGTATYPSMYTLNTGTSPYGVTIAATSVTFPAGSFSGPGNFFVDLQVTPTAFPLSTNTTTVVFTLSNPSAYQFGNPSKTTIKILNTGPQLLILSAVANGNTMYRGVTNDYAKFLITRYGDTNGPGNSPGNVNPVAFTVTNLSYYGTAVYPTDYRARAQRADPLQDGKIQPPQDGPTAIVFYPGDEAVTCVIGNPVMHTNFNDTPVDLTVIFNLTNQVSGAASTNGLQSDEGFTYNVGTAQSTATIIDNAVGPEVVIWSDSMTNAANSVNYTLTYANTNFGAGALPVVIPNYVNNQGSLYGTGTNDFLVNFGADLSTNYYYTAPYPSAPTGSVPPSPVMIASNWPAKALKMTVNKLTTSICGVNVYPNQVFHGNYALRFNMFLSLWQQYVDDPYISANFREYALFGVNHTGTNCNWRPSTTMVYGTGMVPTNSDGQWFAVDSGYYGITPADYESYVPGPVPNNANANGDGLRGKLSSSASYAPQQGVFKHPPFVSSGTSDALRTVANPGGGQAINKWVDVSVEITEQTNQNFTINRTRVFTTDQSLTNGLGLEYSYTNGTIMLGYDDPDRTTSDSSAYVLFSNVRVIELSPYITYQPTLTNNGGLSIIVTQGASVTLTSAVAYATAPITNIWWRGTGTPTNPAFGKPTVAMATNIANATSMETTLTLTNVAAINGTNYISVFSDVAGSVTSRVAAVNVALAPTKQVVLEGATATLTELVAGPVAATGYQWKTNDVSLANSSHYSGVTAATMRVTNAQPVDAGTYTVVITHPDGVVTQSVTLSTVGLMNPRGQTNPVGTTLIMNAPTITGPVTTYRWRKGTSNLSNGGRISGANTATLTITDLQPADAGDYNLQVINGSTLTTRSNKLSVLTPQFSNIQVAGGNTVLTFYSPNTLLDTTNAWTLQSSTVVTGPYVNTPADYTISSGVVQVTLPVSGPSMFYRLIH